MGGGGSNGQTLQTNDAGGGPTIAPAFRYIRGAAIADGGPRGRRCARFGLYTSPGYWGHGLNSSLDFAKDFAAFSRYKACERSHRGHPSKWGVKCGRWPGLPSPAAFLLNWPEKRRVRFQEPFQKKARGGSGLPGAGRLKGATFPGPHWGTRPILGGGGINQPCSKQVQGKNCYQASSLCDLLGSLFPADDVRGKKTRTRSAPVRGKGPRDPANRVFSRKISFITRTRAWRGGSRRKVGLDHSGRSATIGTEQRALVAPDAAGGIFVAQRKEKVYRPDLYPNREKTDGPVYTTTWGVGILREHLWQGHPDGQVFWTGATAVPGGQKQHWDALRYPKGGVSRF